MLCKKFDMLCKISQHMNFNVFFRWQTLIAREARGESTDGLADETHCQINQTAKE